MRSAWLGSLRGVGGECRAGFTTRLTGDRSWRSGPLTPGGALGAGRQAELRGEGREGRGEHSPSCALGGQRGAVRAWVACCVEMPWSRLASHGRGARGGGSYGGEEPDCVMIVCVVVLLVGVVTGVVVVAVLVVVVARCAVVARPRGHATPRRGLRRVCVCVFLWLWTVSASVSVVFWWQLACVCPMRRCSAPVCPVYP